jgi:hypothetical protein
VLDDDDRVPGAREAPHHRDQPLHVDANDIGGLLHKSHRLRWSVRIGRRRCTSSPRGKAVIEVTLEALARRVEALERALDLGPRSSKDDWQRVVGIFTGSDFMKQVDEEGRRIREAERAQDPRQPAGE